MSNLAAGQGAMVAFTTVSSSDDARKLVTALVEENLVACGNIVGPVTSVYRWKGQLCNDPEFLIVMKTHRERLAQLADRLKSLHGYECPELVALPVEAGYTGYLEWLAQGTGVAR